MRGTPEPTARDYMSKRLVTLAPDADVLAAMRTLLDAGISGAPVLDARGNLLGMLTQRDCLKVGLQGIYHQEPAGRVADYMSRPVETIRADASLAQVIERFRQSRYRRFPVMEGNRLVGQISRRDVLRATLDLW